MNIKDKVYEIFERLGLETENRTQVHLFQDIDSIMFITVVLEIEQEFDIEIPDESLTLQSFEDIEKVEELIRRLMSEKSLSSEESKEEIV